MATTLIHILVYHPAVKTMTGAASRGEYISRSKSIHLIDFSNEQPYLISHAIMHARVHGRKMWEEQKAFKSLL